MEILSRLLDKAHSLSLVHGIRLNRSGPPITHLPYADDLLIFGQATTSEGKKNIIFYLDLFSQRTGQALNSHKSSIYLTPNTPLSYAYAVHDFFGFESMTSSS